MRDKTSINKFPPSLFVVFLFILISHFAAYFFARNYKMMIDEVFHYSQILAFKNGDYHLNPFLGMTPGFHIVIALVARLLKAETLANMRFIVFIFNFFTIPVFYLIARKLDSDSALIRTLQFSFLPILFPFFTFIYTDIFSLLFILCMAYFFLKKKYTASLILGILSICIRQNNIVWVGFFHILACLQDRSIKRSFIYVLSYPVFFLLVHFGGLSIGLAPYIYSFIPHGGNIYLILFVMFFLFFPIIVANFTRMIRKINQFPYIVGLIAGLSTLFLATFQNSHPWNHDAFLIHNRILIFFTQNVTLKTYFLIPLVIMLVTLFAVRMQSKKYNLLYPAAILFLMPLTLIEVRYLFVPIVLWMLFRKAEKKPLEIATVIINIVLSWGILYGTLTGKFFP